MTQTVEELAVAVLRIEDERAIERLIYSYGHVLDFGTPEAYAALFTPDGVIEVHSAVAAVLKIDAPISEEGARALTGRGAEVTANGFAFRGHAALQRFVSQTARTFRSLHVSSQPLVTLSGPDTAEATTFLRIYDHAPEARMELTHFGRYIDRFRRTAAGWRISHRICEL